MPYIGRTPANAAITADDLENNIVTADKIASNAVTSPKVIADAITKDKTEFISDGTAGLEIKGDGSSVDGYIQLNCHVNTHGVKIKAPPHSAAQSYTLTLPSSITNDYFLKTDHKPFQCLTQINIGQLNIYLVQDVNLIFDFLPNTPLSNLYSYF